MALLPGVVETLKAEYFLQSYGNKGAFLKKKALELGVSERQLARYLTPELLPEQDKKKRVVEPKNPEYKEWAGIIAQIKKRPPEEAGEISTEQAVKIAVGNGLLPQEALDIDRGTFDRIMREMGFNRTHNPRVRFQAEYANKAHHFDASTSKFLYVSKKVNGEPILRLFRPAKQYKNKPVPVGDRLWVYGIVDDYSGKLCCRYISAVGENISDSVAFLANYGWRQLGLPEKLLADQGVLKKGLASQEFMVRLGVEFPECKPYAKEAHGKIERTWRTLWQAFEMSFFSVDDWKSFEITLTELNTRLERYIEEYNNRPHRYEKGISRENMWHKSCLNRGGVVILPENALHTICRREKRKIGVDGTLKYKGVLYTVKGCYNEDVYVFEGIFADKYVVQCIRTGERFDVEPLQVIKLGEYKAIADTPHQKAVKATSSLNITTSLYTKDQEKDGKIVKIPLKKTKRHIENPLDTSIYTTVEDAVADFCNMTAGTMPIKSPDFIAKVRDTIIKNDLKRVFVRDFANRFNNKAMSN